MIGVHDTRKRSAAAEASPEKRAPGHGRGRGRARPAAFTSSQLRPRPTRARRHDRADLDTLYISEMARSTVLTAEQEVELGRRVVASEQAILEALVRAPSGSRALSALGAELAAGRLDVKALLLNPDQEGLDLGEASERLRAALTSATSPDEEVRSLVAQALSQARLDTDVVEGIIESVREAAEDDAADASAVGVIEAARTELRRSKERLIVGNLRLVVLFARKYLNRGVPLLDLVQEGNLGLMRAADKFDHRRGFRFSTYAAWWIKQALQRGLLDRALRLPVHVADDRRRIGKIRAAFVALHRREPSADEISKLSGLARERVFTILNLPAQPSSLDAPVGEEGDARVGDFVAASTALPDEAAAFRALGKQLEGMLHTLTERERQVLRMRFGLGHPREHTLEEVGRAMSLTRERIRQIERVALDKLRARSERIELKSYLDR
jgi:RNA polymerase primary sigma factor